MSKKPIIILMFGAILILFVMVVITSTKPIRPSQPLPVPIYSPVPSNVPQNLTSEQKIDSKQQAAYAQTRAEYLQQNPWILKLPLEADDYFIIYDPENDVIRATVYYSSKSSTPKEDQLNQARQDAQAAISALDPNFAKKQIKYIETDKTP